MSRTCSRLNRHSSHPDHSTCDVDEGEEVSGAAVEPRREAAEVLELIEAAFDAVAFLVERDVVRDRNLARAGRRDDSEHAGVSDQLAQSVAVVGFVGDDGAALDAFQQRRRGDDIVDLAAGENEAQRAAERIGEHVDFAGQSSSGAPQSLILVPPFPVAACWCARTRVVSSMRYSFLRSLVRTSKTRSHAPFLAQRTKRVCTLFHLPYRAGRSCQRAPERRTHKTPLTNRRLSPAVRPGSPALPGSKASMRCHCASASS